MTRTLVTYPGKTMLHIIRTPEATGGPSLCGVKPFPARWQHAEPGAAVCVDCLEKLKKRRR